MKTIGLLGGMSWESTLTYYKAINEGVKKELGGLHSAKIVLYSVDFAEIEKLQDTGQWGKAGALLSEAAKGVQCAGADFLLLCTNTMHNVVSQIEENIDIPVLHIADATAEELLRNNVKKAGLLGTKFTMEQDFYKNRIKENFGIDIIIPDEEERETVHNIIYEELCQGIMNYTSEEKILDIIKRLSENGSEAVILGCTEIPMIIGQEDTDIPLYDTTLIHADAAVKKALKVP
ncbi:MAG: aspartate/glutamate racemase family protein [Flexistipes sinusarabici]|uniref:Aspartate/glutamate racemase family protein n=1 Tax=Flexistipes sinusarabici TaxID=2352 RepID=A0A5D0MMH6_FLESI|nr:aspartate/glutamate racemase family protein [Flexistipes sinusarabici]TYB32813.1 MAG: aspartate/glutamate racemase family protein [Flexistipes sinusarabici]